MNEASTIAIIGILGSTVAALIWIIKYLFDSFKPAMDELVKVTQANTSATTSADTYLKQRNGRDIEFHTEIMAKLKDIPSQAVEAVKIVAEELKRVGDLTAETLEHSRAHQIIKEQTVEKQIISKV